MAIKTSTSDQVNIFLIGNNPIELSNIYEKLKVIRTKTYKTEIGFEIKGLFNRIMKFNPACILIDDNMELNYLKKLMSRLSKSAKTQNIPIAILKNSNADTLLGAQDYVLKDGVTSDSLSRSIANSIRLKKIQQSLSIYYNKKKSQMKRWLK